MPRTKDVTGQRFTRLVAVGNSGKCPRSGKRLWLCQCDCGNQIVVVIDRLTTGNTRSCGCLQTEARTRNNYSHGKTGTPEYKTWQGIKRRCNNPNTPCYSRYGGAGIMICERWDSFENFLADMGEKPTPEHTIDRINSKGPYEPGNCRWATLTEQSNNRDYVHLITANGKTQHLKAWALEIGLHSSTIIGRLQRGWKPEDAVTTPRKRPSRRHPPG